MIERHTYLLLTHTTYILSQAGNMVRGGDKMAYWTTAQMYTFENATFIGWPDSSM